jgi:hypothetical protein
MFKGPGVAATLAVLTVGCSTQEGYQRIVNSYVGLSEASVLTNWGPPDRVYNSDAGVKYLTYSRSRSGYVAGVPASFQTSCSFGVCASIPVGGAPGYSYTNACTTFFKLVDGTVDSWGFRGNACRA